MAGVCEHFERRAGLFVGKHPGHDGENQRGYRADAEPPSEDRQTAVAQRLQEMLPDHTGAPVPRSRCRGGSSAGRCPLGWFLADDLEQRVSRRELDQRVDVAVDDETERRAVRRPLDSFETGYFSKLSVGGETANVSSSSCRRMFLSSETPPILASRPSRMIATRSHADRPRTARVTTGTPCAPRLWLRHHVSELLLVQWIQPVGRLVQNQHPRRCMNA